jgi:hypothetical protein
VGFFVDGLLRKKSWPQKDLAIRVVSERLSRAEIEA